MDRKTLGKALLFPPLPLAIALLPVAGGFLVLSMVLLGSASPVACLSYALAAYTLTVWCARAPAAVRRFRAFREKNALWQRLRSDEQLRLRVGLYGTLATNALYGLFQVGLGLYHRTFWFLSIGAYYLCLGALRFFLARYAGRHAPGALPRAELVRYRASGAVLLGMNLALSLIVFFMVYWGRSFDHHMITAIAMAAYTFAAFAIALWGFLKKQGRSPILSAVRTVNLAAALVSMLTLESTMLSTFADGTLTATARKLMLAITGGAVMALIVAMAVHMIVSGTKKLKNFEVYHGR